MNWNKPKHIFVEFYIFKIFRAMTKTQFVLFNSLVQFYSDPMMPCVYYLRYTYWTNLPTDFTSRFKSVFLKIPNKV